MKKYFEILRKCPLFDGISDEDLDKLLVCLGAKVMSFGKKYTILAEGLPANHIGIMLSGAAQVVQMDYYGNRSIVAGVGEAEIFGESFACAEVSVLPVAVIASKNCEVMLIDSSRILHSCSNACGFHQQLILNVMKDLAKKNLMFHQKIEILSKRTTREKLMTYLLMQAKSKGTSSFRIPFDRQELADYLEVDRSGLSAEISKLRAEGILESERSNFTLLREFA